MSSHGTTENPTPGTSSTSERRIPQNLAQEIQDQEMKEESDSDDDNEELKRQLERNNNELREMKNLFNQNVKALKELQEQARRTKELEKEVTTLRAAANVISAPVEGRERLKLNTPTTFDGTPGQLKGYLVQIRTYQAFHINTFQNDTERVVHAATFLKGKALAWFEPLQQEWLDTPIERYSQEVKDIFFSFSGYVKALQSLFLDPDEKRQAERELASLRQNKSATMYAAEFRRLAARLDMTDESKVFAFYQGLKDDVKDEMAKVDTPPSFLDYVEYAIKIDNRLFERRKEKGEKRQTANSGKKYQWQPQHKFNNKNQNNRNNNQQSTAHGQHSGPMDLSVAQKDKPRRREFKCYNCDKPGHMARHCIQPKKLTATPKQANAATKIPSHEEKGWTACYDNDCTTHRHAKENSGWYPQNPAGRSGYDTTNIPKAIAVIDRYTGGPDYTKQRQEPLDDWEQAKKAAELNNAFQDGSIVYQPGLLWDIPRLANYRQTNEVNTPESLSEEEARKLEEENETAIKRIQDAINYTMQIRNNSEVGDTLQHMRKTRDRRIALRGNTRGQYQLKYKATQFVYRPQNDGKTERTLAVASKYARKATEQLDEMLRQQQFRDASTQTRSSPYTTVASDSTFELPQRTRATPQPISEWAEDVVDRPPSAEVRPQGTSIDDTDLEDAEEEHHLDRMEKIKEVLEYKYIDPQDDCQQIAFHAEEYHNKIPTTITQTRDEEIFLEDDPRITTQHREHKEIAWIYCIFDHCAYHLSKKAENELYPKRKEELRIRRAYEEQELSY
ncbi:reverse transcriptase domain protein [Colletotrichum truncatum]|uniref:Reverse transcriptase domain protein n=1 Tax=Colletotrichum truncatum TaxID=5467 RepID=A0ACC3YDG1_COLTU|nr:reverse transcriptase domain protein [Colletotrichum truncatum]KAF6783065.1 reverse transcriptase domain protein [Colletotrichum truncatum]